jgi:hypothetical protein
MPQATVATASSRSTRHRDVGASDSEADDADLRAYLRECRDAAEVAERADRELDRNRVTVLEAPRPTTTPSGAAPLARVAQATAKRRQAALKSLLAAPGDPGMPTMDHETLPSSATISRSMAHALMGVAAAATLQAGKPVPLDCTSGSLIQMALRDKVSPQAVNVTLRLAAALRGIREGLTRIERIDVESSAQGPAPVSAVLRVRSLRAVGRAADAVVRYVSSWAVNTVTSPAGIKATSHVGSAPPAPRVDGLAPAVRAGEADDDSDRLGSWLPEESRLANNASDETPPVSHQTRLPNGTLGALLSIENDDVLPLTIMTAELLQTLTGDASRTPVDICTEAASSARSAGNEAADRVASSWALLALWPYVQYALSEILADPEPENSEHGTPANVSDVMPDLIPSAMRRAMNQARNIGAHADSAARIWPHHLEYAFIRLMVSSASSEATLHSEQAAAADSQTPITVANLAGEYPEAAPAPVSPVHLALFRRSDDNAAHGGHLVFSTEALDRGVVLSNKPGVQINSEYSALHGATVVPDGSLHHDERQVDSALLTATSGKLHPTSIDELLGGAVESNVSSPARSTVDRTDRPFPKGQPRPSQALPSSVFALHDRSAALTRRRLLGMGVGPVRRGHPDADEEEEPATFSILLDGSTSVPLWISRHVAGAFIKLTDHLQLQEYMSIASNGTIALPSSAGSAALSVSLDFTTSAGMETPSPGFLALIALLDVASLGGDIERFTTRFIDPMTANVQRWVSAPVASAQANFLSALFSETMTGLPFATYATLYVKPSSVEQESTALPLHMRVISCFRALRLHLNAATHSAKAFDPAVVFREFVAGQHEWSTTASAVARAAARGGERLHDPRMSSMLSLHALLAFSVRLLEKKWCELGYLHRRRVIQGGNSTRSAGELHVCVVHGLRYVLDAVRRFLLHDLRIAADEFHRTCPRLESVTALREAYSNLSAQVEILSLSTQDTRPIYRHIESIAALAVEVCLSPQSASGGAEVSQILSRLQRLVSGACEAITASAAMAHRASALVSILTFNGYFSGEAGRRA